MINIVKVLDVRRYILFRPSDEDYLLTDRVSYADLVEYVRIPLATVSQY